MEIEPRTSMERHLMDRDREGQLYLESRREQAVQDLLGHRTSFLSTITPPSTNPSSAASSLFHEPMYSSTQDAVVEDSAPSQPDAPITPITSNPNLSSASTPAFLTLTPSLQNIVPIIKKRRQGSASAQGRAPATEDRPMLPILPSSLEYQLTASLLKYPTVPPPAALSDSNQPRSRSRSKPRQQKSRRGTVNSDARTESTGHRHTGSKASDDVEILGFEHRRKYSYPTIGPMTPTSPSSSTPSSPTAMQGSFNQFASSADKQPRLPQLNLPPTTPSPPLPPLPLKSTRSLIAHYFPSSLPPPPSRDRGQVGQREPLVAPTPFKTPTFGPALTQAMFIQDNAPSLPSPSASFHYIPSANVSRCSTAQPHVQEDLELQSSSGRPSPCTSALGLSVSTNRAQQPRGPPSDLDFLPVNPSRGRFHNHQHSLLYRNQHINNFVIHNNNNNNNSSSSSNTDNVDVSAEDSASTMIAIFSPLDTPQVSSLSSGIRHYGNVTTAQTTPIYPRGLMPNGASPLAEHPLSIQQKPVPYVRELIPGKEDISTSSGPSSANTSRDLEIVIEEITGRIRTNRTSFDPWPYYISPDDEESMPTAQQQKRNQYWVFRDQDGIVPGPYFFLLGHLCPVLWWIGSVYPNVEHPDNLPAAERDGQAEDENDAPVADLRDHPMIQWLQRRLRTAGATITSIKTSAANSMQPSDTIATLQIGRISQEAEREASILGHNHNNGTNISTIHVPIPPPLQMVSINLLDTYGPWAAEGQAASMEERRLEHDQKMIRYDLDMRWRRINLIWSIGSFVLAVSITAFVIGFA
ncbi:hypothetical protein BGZ58_001680 [Dissophora ornata]|nr:hypothetical protein BGZ58_001680 [Dissophora ornata]